MSGKRYYQFVAIVAFAALAASCAKERPARSYIQPNIIKKTDLTGEWYYAPTVVDIGYGTSVTFLGEVGWDISIIKWDIQEDVVYARLAYDRIRNTESLYNSLDGLAWQGEPIGAWKVEHFDIIRDYNSTTGEETNVLKESKERPWYQREFIRVDWSDNLISNWNLIWRRAATIDPVSYIVTDPDHPHAPVLERNPDNGLVDFIGVTSKLLVTPDMRDIDFDFAGLSAIPDCFFYGSTTTCTSTEVVLRHAFARKDPDREYVPRVYLQTEQDEYGYFLTQRLNYNREYSVTVSGIEWYANTFNLYSEWYKKAEDDATAALYAGSREFTCDGGGAPCRFDDDNSKVFVMGGKAVTSDQVPANIAGSTDPDDAFVCRCDTQVGDCNEACFFVSDGSPVFFEDANGAERVQLRPRERGLRPVVYYLNAQFPNQLKPTMQQVAAGWAKVLNHSVWLAAGCPHEDFDVQGCANRPEFDDPAFSMLVLCENNVVQEGDPPECGPVGKEIRLGDIRYSHVVWIDAPQQSSPLGYGPPLADPLTGETISAISNIYGAPLDSYSRHAMEVVQMLSDSNFAWDDYLFGRFQADFIRRNLQGGYQNGMPQPASRNKVGHTPNLHRRSWESRTYTGTDITKLYKQMSMGWTHAIPGSSNMPGPDANPQQVRNWLNARANAIKTSNVLGNGTNPQLMNLNRLRNSPFEDLMMTPAYLAHHANSLAALGYDPNTVTSADIPPSSSLRSKVSPLTKLNVKYLRAVNRIKAEHYSQTIMYPEMIPFQEPSVIGLAAELACGLCCDPSEQDADGRCVDETPTSQCMGDLAAQTAKWGADAGCRDKIKHRLREMIFHGVTLHEMGHNMGLRHNFKGSFDSMNYFDEYWDIRKMDGTIGPRTSDPRTPLENLSKIAEYQYTSIMDYGGKFNSDFHGLGRYDVAAIHHAYSTFTQVFNQVNNIPLIGTIQNFRNFSWPTPVILYFAGPEAVNYTEFHYDPVISPDGAVDTGEANRAWVPRQWIRPAQNFGDTLLTDVSIEQMTGGSQARVMVPYKFCSDEFRNTSLGCNLFDEGADLYEITENQIQAYENYYVFNNFGRDSYKFGWDEDYYPSRLVSRYFDIMQNHLQYYVLYASIFHDWGIWTPDQIETFFTDPSKGWGTFTTAISRTFETFSRIFFHPEPGCYIERERPDKTTYFYRDVSPEFCDVPEPGGFFVDYMDGKYWDDSWNFDLGYQWYLQQTRIGQFYDRPISIQMLAFASNNFLGRDTQTDLRQFTINYARVFPEHIKVMFQAIQSGDLSTLAPSYCGNDAQGNAIIEHRDVTNLDAPRCSLTGGTFQGHVDPGDSFTTQLYTAAYGMAMFPLNYSQEFVDMSRVYVESEFEGISYPPGTTLATFADPFSFKTYGAVRYPDTQLLDNGNTYSPSIGARAIDQANTLLGHYNTALANYNSDPTNLDFENELYTTTEHLKNFIQNLDMLRSLSYMYERSNLIPTLDND